MIKISLLETAPDSKPAPTAALGPQALVGMGPQLERALQTHRDPRGRYLVMCFDADTATTCARAGFPTVVLEGGKPGAAVTRGVWQALREHSAVITVLGDRQDMDFDKSQWLWVRDGACREGIALRCAQWDRLPEDRVFGHQLDEQDVTTLLCADPQPH